MPLARNCAMSVAPVDMVGSIVALGYIAALTFSNARYISESRREDGETGRKFTGIGSSFTAGSLITPFSVSKNLGMSSSGNARTSKVASACEGMTFGPTPALRIVGTTEERIIEDRSRSFSASEFWIAGDGVAAR